MHCVMDSPVGHLHIACDDTGITQVSRTADHLLPARSPLLQACVQQLTEYFAGQRRDFNLPLSLHGTAFQLRAWQALQAIPYGETRSYGQQAAMMGSPRACRAVGGANHRNPVCIIVPCHRVIGSGGALTGYGAGLDMKAYLLDMERRYVHAGQSRSV